MRAGRSALECGLESRLMAQIGVPKGEIGNSRITERSELRVPQN